MESQSMLKMRELLDALEGNTGDPADLNNTLHYIAHIAKTFFAADSCGIFAINPITNRFIGSLTVAGKLLKRDNMSYKQPGPQGIAPQVLKRGVLVVEDLETAPEYHSAFTRSEGIRSFTGLALRMKLRQRPLGVLYLNFRQKRSFSSDEHELFQIFADQASFILQETWLLRRYQEVARIGQEINQELSTVDTLFQRLRKHAAGILDTSHALLLIVYQQQANTFDLYIEEEGHFIFRENYLPGGAGQYIIKTQQKVFIEQLSKDAKHLPFQIDHIPGTEPKESFIFVPLAFRDVPLGFLSIQHPQPNAYNQEDLSILQLLANHIALALHNMHLYNNLGRLNETGQLLTQQLDSEQTLQAIVDKIRDAAQADVVVLYPYEPLPQRFIFPPRMAGALLASNLRSMFPSRPDDIASLALSCRKPIFAKESAILYTELQGDVHIRQGDFQERERIRSTAALPLQVGDEIVGVLFVNFRQPQRFDATQKLFIEGLAHYAAIAIKNSQVFGTLSQRRLRELEILQNIDRELSRTLELETVLNTLLRFAQEHVPAEEASILLHNPRTQVLETVAAIGLHAEASRMQTISLQETKGITRWVLEQKKPARVNNVHDDSPWRDLHLPVTADIVSELDVPLLDGEEVVGILNFESIREHAFHQEDQDFLLTFAGQAVLAIKNAQAYEREKRLAAEAKVLNEISKEIISQLDLTYVFNFILEKALELTRSTTGALMIYDRDHNDLWMAAEHGVALDKKGKRLSLDEGIAGYVAINKQLLNVDPSQPPWNMIYLDYIPGTRSELALPMLAGNDLRGVLDVESASPNNFSESDEGLLKGLADLAVIALQNAQAYEREKRLAAEAKVLNEISKEIIIQLDHVHVFDLILEKALELTRSSTGTLELYDPKRNDLWMAAERGVVEEKKNQRMSLDQGVVGYVAKNRQLLNVDLSEPSWKNVYESFILGTRSELAVPMLAGNELRGVLNVESSALNNFSESDERLLQGLADLAVIALQNAQAYEWEKHLAAESQVLNEVSKEITSQLDLAHVFDLILEKALELTHSTLGSLHLFDPDLQDLSMVAEWGVAKDKKGQRQKLHQGIIGYVAALKQVCNVADVSHYPWNEIYMEFFPGVRSELTVPMLAGNELRGVLNVESPSLNNFSESHERLLKGLADLAVIALQNAERYQQAETEAQRFELLYQAGQELARITDLKQLELAYDIVVQNAGKQSQSQAVIYRYDEMSAELVLKSSSPYRQASFFDRIKLGEGLNGQVAREHRTIVIHDSDNLPSDVVSIKKSDPSMHSLVITPIMFKDHYYGNLGLRHEVVGHFQGSDILFFESLAQQLASTIHRLETTQERQEFEQRALSAEEMSSIGQSAFEVTHRLGNDLGLVELYVSDIRSELEKLGITNTFLERKLQDIVQSVQAVLSLSTGLKNELAKMGDKEERAGEPVLIAPRVLLEEAQAVPSMPPNIQICLEIEEDVAAVRVLHSLVIDILRNLIANAIQAMPEGGLITLRARNAGRSVVIEVVDTGIGIHPQKLSNIFDLFFSTKGSSGFGLWSARRNALRNRGDLKAESKLGQGTTFILSLPRIDVGTV